MRSSSFFVSSGHIARCATCEKEGQTGQNAYVHLVRGVASIHREGCEPAERPGAVAAPQYTRTEKHENLRTWLLAHPSWKTVTACCRGLRATIYQRCRVYGARGEQSTNFSDIIYRLAYHSVVGHLDCRDGARGQLHVKMLQQLARNAARDHKRETNANCNRPA